LKAELVQDGKRKRQKARKTFTRRVDREAKSGWRKF